MARKSQRKPNNLQVYILALIAVVLLASLVSYIFFTPKSTDSQAEQTTSHVKKKGYDAYANIPSSEISYGGGIIELMWNPNDPYYGYDNSSITARVYIDSIDGGRNYDPDHASYTIPLTYGKMTVLAVYKGDIKPGQQLNYTRGGGIITLEEYIRAGEAKGDKNLRYFLTRNGDAKKYYKYTAEGDIDIEVDKEYFVYLYPQTSKDGKKREYDIGPVQYGLREVRGTGNNITILNNDTKKWESLRSVVRLN